MQTEIAKGTATERRMQALSLYIDGARNQRQLPNTFEVRYRGTPVFVMNRTNVDNRDGMTYRTVMNVILNTGGYETATTKRRINQALKEFDLDMYVEQVDYAWRVRYQAANNTHGTIYFVNNGILFQLEADTHKVLNRYTVVYVY